MVKYLRSKKLLYLITLFTFLFDQLIVIYTYFNMQYSSDGFHYYVFLNNVSNGFIHEGPTFGNLLNKHSYITLVLLAPLIHFFGSPLVLGLLSNLLWWISFFLLSLIARHFIHHQLILFSYLILFLWTTVPFFAKVRYGTIYLFQPDFLGPPLFLSFVYFVLVSKTRLALLFYLMAILVKEDLPLWYLLISLLLFPQLYKKTLLLSSLAFMGHLSVLYIFSKYSGDNSTTIMEVLSVFNSNKPALILGLILIVAYALILIRTKASETLIKSLLLFVLFSCLFFISNVVIYGWFSGQVWRNFSVLGPALTLFLFLFISRFSSVLNHKLLNAFYSFVPILTALALFGAPAIWIVKRNSDFEIKHFREIQKVIHSVDTRVDKGDIFLIEPYAHAPLLDLVNNSFVEIHPLEPRIRYEIEKVDFVLLRNLDVPALTNYFVGFELISFGDSFSLYRRSP